MKRIHTVLRSGEIPPPARLMEELEQLSESARSSGRCCSGSTQLGEPVPAVPIAAQQPVPDELIEIAVAQLRLDAQHVGIEPVGAALAP